MWLLENLHYFWELHSIFIEELCLRSFQGQTMVTFCLCMNLLCRMLVRLYKDGKNAVTI